MKYDVVAKMAVLASPGEKLQASRAVIRLYGADMPVQELAAVADDHLRAAWAAKAARYDARPQSEKDAEWRASRSYRPSYEGMQSLAQRGALDDKSDLGDGILAGGASTAPQGGAFLLSDAELDDRDEGDEALESPTPLPGSLRAMFRKP